MISRIGGYPPWVQSEDDMPQCPVCGAWAEFVGAIGSGDTGLIWGDSGYWYFFACKANCGMPWVGETANGEALLLAA
jgi:hypothetical protein